MTYLIRDIQEYQKERLHEAEQYRLIKLAKSGRQRPQRWQWIYDKPKEVLSLIKSSIAIF